MSITEERKKKVAFSNKYYNTPAKFVRKKGSGTEINAASLKGKAIGVQRATIHENFLRDNYGKIVDIKAYDTQENANLDFAAGRVDTPRRGRREVEKRADRGTGAASGLELEHLAEQNQGDDHRRRLEIDMDRAVRSTERCWKDAGHHGGDQTVEPGHARARARSG